MSGQHEGCSAALGCLTWARRNGCAIVLHIINCSNPKRPDQWWAAPRKFPDLHCPSPVSNNCIHQGAVSCALRLPPGQKPAPLPWEVRWGGAGCPGGQLCQMSGQLVPVCRSRSWQGWSTCCAGALLPSPASFTTFPVVGQICFLCKSVSSKKSVSFPK